jgi:hypothetical protein
MRHFILRIKIGIRDIRVQIEGKVSLIYNFPGKFKFIDPTLAKE